MTLEVHHNSDLFTPRERCVIGLYWQGITSDKAIAQEEDVAPDTIRKVFRGIHHKLGLPFGARRDQAMIKALEKGLIDIRRKAAALVLAFLSTGWMSDSLQAHADDFNDTDYARYGRLRGSRKGGRPGPGGGTQAGARVFGRGRKGREYYLFAQPDNPLTQDFPDILEALNL